MRCEEIMNREVECVSPHETVLAAAQRMRDKDIGFLPICDQKRVLGTVTDRDIVVRLVANEQAYSIPCGEIMTHEVISCRPGDDIRRAEELLATYKKSRIMCLGDDGKLAGVISLADIARIQRDSDVAGTVREVKKP
ncbi:MAG TPA: CBS domain-containing protein [Polyangia bacterium]|jgi:CBS domain-containing protein